MKRAVVDPDKCKNCKTCLVEVKCTHNAIIREDPLDKPWIDFYKCSGCLKCKTYCQNGAIAEIARPCGNVKIGW